MCPSQAFTPSMTSSFTYKIHTFYKELDTISEEDMPSLPKPILLLQKDLHALEATVLLPKLWRHAGFRGGQHHSQQ